MSHPGNQVTDPPAQRRRRMPGLRGHDPVQLTVEDEEHYAFISAIGGGSGFAAQDGDPASGWGDRRARPATDGYAPPARGHPDRRVSTPPDLADYVPRARSGYAPADLDSAPSGQRPTDGLLALSDRVATASPPAPSSGAATDNHPAPSSRATTDNHPAPSGRATAASPSALPAGSATGGSPLLSGGRNSRSRRGPASGYPPMPGEPGPWYSEPQFSAWNAVAEEHRGDAHHLPVPAPTWSDTRDTFIATGGGPNGGGVALAERAGWAGEDLAEQGGQDLAGWAGEDLAEQGGQDLAGWAGQDLAEQGGQDLAGWAGQDLAEQGGRDLAGWAGQDLAERVGDNLAELSGEGLETRTARFAGEGTPVPAAPADIVAPAVAPPDHVDAGGPAESQEPLSDVAIVVAEATGRTRAAMARARKTARRKGRVRRRVVVAGVCLPAIAVVAAMAYVHHPGGSAAGSSPGSHAAPAAAAVSHPSPSLGPWQHIATRAADPAPLTLSQLFPAQFTVRTASYTRTAQLGSTHCSRAVFGTSLQGAVRKYGCSQVMRASYLASAQKLMGTIGVLNLGNSAGASRVGRVTGSSQFVGQLTAASGPTHSLTKGTGLEEAEVKGHYLILTWVEFTTLRAPRTASERAQLKAFSADLISRTANVSLTSRMVTGKPQVP